MRRLSVEPISSAEHLAFVRAQRSVSFLQTPAWGSAKTEWRSESLGWYDGRQLVGAGLVLHRPVPKPDRCALAYLPEGPVIDWTGDIDRWLDPLAAYLKAYLANRVVGTKALCAALEEAQRNAETLGFGLLLWDGYRPRRAVD